MKNQQKIFLLVNIQADLFELKRVLGRAGYEVLLGKTSGSVSDQLALADPDISILEQDIVEEEGEQIQKCFPGKPVIAWMKKKDSRAAVNLISSGAFDCVSPPVRPEEVLGVLEHALKKSRKRQQARPPFVERHLETMLVSLGIAAAAVAAAIALRVLFAQPGIEEFKLNYQNPTSIFCSGNYIWTSDWYTQGVYQYKIGGGKLELARTFHFQSCNPYSVAYIGDLLWVADVCGKVNCYELLKEDYVMRNMFTAPGRANTGYCAREGYLWSVDAESKKIYKHDPGNPEKISAVYAYPGIMPVGLYWDGAFFWSADGKTGNVNKHAGPEKDFKILSTYLIVPEGGGQLSGLSGDRKNLWLIFSGQPAKILRYPFAKLK